jgi:hypothetical protein
MFVIYRGVLGADLKTPVNRGITQQDWPRRGQQASRLGIYATAQEFKWSSAHAYATVAGVRFRAQGKSSADHCGKVTAEYGT